MPYAVPDPIDRTVVERRDPLLGALLDDRFRIEFRLAAGGFGAIYRATHVESGAEVALKVLHPDLQRDSNVVARFRREGATLVTLRDEHTITAYELGEAPDGTLYIVMELLRGESLYERFKGRGPIGWRQVAGIARSVCSSLGEAHALGIVHRDLKPANIHLERRGGALDFVKVLDFGIAKILHGSELDTTELTHAGQMIGTLDYMSPEQMVGGECTGASDIYTLGIVMYEMISGVRPFGESASTTAMLAALLTTTPEPLSARTPVPVELDRIVMRCLEREPQNRFADVAQLEVALARVLAPIDDDGATLVVAQPIVDPEGTTVLDQRSRHSAVRAKTPTPPPVPARAIARPPDEERTLAGAGAAPRTRQARGSAPILPTGAPQPHPGTPGSFSMMVAPPGPYAPRPPFQPAGFPPPEPLPPMRIPATPAPAPFAMGTDMPMALEPAGPPLSPWQSPAPTTGYYPAPRAATAPIYDAGRDALVRRLVWGAVVVLAIAIALIIGLR